MELYTKGCKTEEITYIEGYWPITIGNITSQHNYVYVYVNQSDFILNLN